MCVTHQFDSDLKGAVNAGLLDDFSSIQVPVSVSPKTLPPDEKLTRWESAWMDLKYDI